MLEYAAVASAGFLASLVSTPLVARIAREKGIVRPDVHKPGEPPVPTLGGIAVLAGITCSSTVACALFSEYRLQVLTLLATSLILAAIGLADDVLVLRGTTKTCLTVLAIAPILLAGYLHPAETGLWLYYRPPAPIVGRLRLTILYWLLLPLAVAGPANAMNMIDAFNGVMTSTALISLVALVASSIVLGNRLCLVLSAILIGPLLGFLPFNVYPSRIFAGDVGGLVAGGTLGAVAVLSKMEFVTMVALMPEILNAFYVVSSVRGFVEHRELGEKPTYMLPDYRLRPSASPRAPITLTRMLLLFGGEGGEVELIKAILAVQAVSALLAFATSLLML